METDTKTPRKRRTWLWIVGGVFVILCIAAFALYSNFNRILSAALMKNFNSSSISDVYELKFEKLNVNPFLGNISVFDVVMQPRDTPLHSYPYINTWFKLTTHKLILTNVEIFSLLRNNQLKLDRIEIGKPEVDLKITDEVPILFPFKDTTGAATAAVDTTKKKKTIGEFSLKEFELINASFHVTNFAKQREFYVKDLNISLRDMLIDQTPGINITSYSHIELSIAEATGKLQKESIRHVSFKDYKFSIDSLRMQKTLDTFIYHFADFHTGIKALDIQTADSILHLAMQSFDLSYRDKSIKLDGVSFKPNISEAAMQARYKYQNTQFQGSFGSINLIGVNFDSLIYNHKLFIDEVDVDSVSAALFKDKTKQMDPKRFPDYLGQSLKAVPLPLLVKQVKVTNANLLNRERNEDGSYAAANVNRATAEVKNVTNILIEQPLAIKADAYLENKVHFFLTLDFSYLNPEFNMSGKFGNFNLTDLNPIIQAYSPAKINGGVVDEISFSGTAYHTNSSGTMKFLYHDLKIDMELQKEKAKWMNSVVAFTANSLVPTANPAPGQPARVVQFHADRDMHKAFVNLVIKSVLNGLQETVVMSKENRKAHQQQVKKAKAEGKK